ncbi:hypothetical protein P9A47_gp58 [Xanthomonas phage Elanor]|uniref:Uncharacterized protein n=1 Tax=Xanthomonas phage Elanor TaxID=2939127 RepID=A0A9E7E197_9CAUD|nr:hypothetical protein P9A47_gp58 [Xanthomonas phage Elanor]URA07026.1 hypothetical protein Elanor_BL40058 [Xanthomonas phage Elanor]
MLRVENMAGEGDPDVQGCHNGRYFELELKGCNRPKRPDSLLVFDVRQSQVIWHRKRWRCGGNVWLYARVGTGREVKRYLVPGCHTGLVKEGVTEAMLAGMSVLDPGHSAAELLAFAVDSLGVRKALA